MSDPVLIAYGIRRSASGRTRWTRVGEAYAHDQGAGLTLRLDAVPRDGHIILLELDAADDERSAIRAARHHSKRETQRVGNP